MKTLLNRTVSLAQLQEFEDLMLKQGLSPMTGRPGTDDTLEFTERKTKKPSKKAKSKPQCSIGYSCGFTCIAGSKVCRSYVTPSNAAKILSVISSKSVHSNYDLITAELARKALDSPAPATKHTVLSGSEAVQAINDEQKLWIGSKHAKALDKLINSNAGHQTISFALSYRSMYASLGAAYDGSGYDYYFAKSANGRQAAAAAVAKSQFGLYIEGLVGNPLALVGSDAEKADVRGGGSAMLSHIAKQAIEHSEATGKPPSIRLLAIDSAVSFYEKLGATVPGPNPLHVFDEAAIRKLAGLG